MQLPNVCSNSTLWSLENDRDTYRTPHEFGQKAPLQGNSVGDGSLSKIRQHAGLFIHRCTHRTDPGIGAVHAEVVRSRPHPGDLTDD